MFPTAFFLLLTFLPVHPEGPQLDRDTTLPYLDPAVRIVTDSAEYESFRVYVINPTDSQVVIESLEPSCGCILATIQRSRATREKPGDIYVAVTTSRMDTLQPMTIDVITNRMREHPLRLTIWKRSYGLTVRP